MSITTPPGDQDPDHDRPLAYWVARIVSGLAITGLAVGDLVVTDATVEPFVYVLIAGGPDLLDALRRGKS